jgi:hypothetical protein
MKKYIMIVATVLLGLTACEKEDLTMVDNNTTTNETVQNDRIYVPPMGHFGVYVFGQGCQTLVLATCIAPGFPIPPMYMANFDDFEGAVLDGPGEIGAFFNGENWDEVFPELTSTDPQTEDILENLKSGIYDLVPFVTNPNTINYFGGPAGMVSESEYEFVLQVNFE